MEMYISNILLTFAQEVTFKTMFVLIIQSRL